MKRIALKIDVDTYRGTLTGVPNLVDLLQRSGAAGTFFFSLGPDHSGRYGKGNTGSLAAYYDLRTRLYGRLLPAPDIGARCADILRQTASNGFEAGVHAWDRAVWEGRIGLAENGWVEDQMNRSCTRFSEIFSGPAEAHAAAGWRMNRHALRLTQRLGFSYSSDCRGTHPFMPVVDGELIDCPQLPTTLPTLDEVFSVEPGLSPGQAADRILHLSLTIAGDHVFSLRAELEGLTFLGTLEHLIAGWAQHDCQLVSLHDLYSTLVPEILPRHSIHPAEIPGRHGLRLKQGAEFPHD